MKKPDDIDKSYTNFYERHKSKAKVYPTEFVVRTFLAKYPGLDFEPIEGGKILDLGFGDGRNMSFLIEQGYQTYGVEITQAIVDLVQERLRELKLKSKELKVGKNHNIPFEDELFDMILGCHVSYYCDNDTSFKDNLNEFVRLLKPGGWFISSFITTETYMMENCTHAKEDHHYIVWSDPYKNRNAHKFIAFENFQQIEDQLTDKFHRFSFGNGFNNYYGIDEKVLWVVCQKK